jgi:transcriptional regulator with AAA-type ATPase domain
MSHPLDGTMKLKGDLLTVGGFRVEVVAGPDAGRGVAARDGTLTVGTAEGVALRLSDPAVSRYHLELEATAEGVVLRDLGSTNGTSLGGALVREARLVSSTDLGLGHTHLRVVIDGSRGQVPISKQRSFGALVGASEPMRRVYATLERAAPTTVPVLVLGQSGTGKELAARALHSASTRASRPLEVVDCGGLPPTLVESELFGHERGAFTGATHDKEGAFERADGGTLFLDELGELPLEVQPKLLRVAGRGGGAPRGRSAHPQGGRARRRRHQPRPAPRGQRRALSRRPVLSPRGDHRADAALRERLDDLPLIVPAMVERIVRERRVRGPVAVDAALLARLQSHDWPGNVRELRNYLEQYVVLEVAPPFEGTGEGAAGADGGEEAGLIAGLDALPLRAAKTELVERFERRYLTRLLAESGGNVAEAARRAGVDRATVFRTLRRTGLREG